MTDVAGTTDFQNSSGATTTAATASSSSFSQEDFDLQKNERLHLFPRDRIQALASTGAVIGGMLGFYEGVQKAAARYLVENAHRLPTTKGGWYFYHKRKNYEMIVGGVSSGIKSSVKYGGFIGALALIESGLDLARGQLDFVNTTLACFVGTTLITRYKQLGTLQARKMVFRGTVAGLLVGLAQDAMIYARGGRVWYVNEAKKRLH
ncbi:uncharacterized protein LODBEIA_P08630 [Lodderomyces beijingensis]|uniref:Uncharacterized protein n=1 Tax=Lodderomyces beijingensis TaxID=1775926 RepID=A0ABP0ZEQ1_9ASCO